MKRLNIILFIGIIFVSILNSCNKEPSLQQYYIDKQEDKNFISIDIPTNIISLKENATSEAKETYKSLKKLNLLIFKINEKNKTEYVFEKTNIKNILDQKKFNELIRAKHKKSNAIVKYLGDDDAIDEFIVFASEDEKGFILARVIGKNMQPDKIIKLLKDIDSIEQDNPIFNEFKHMFTEIK